MVILFYLLLGLGRSFAADLSPACAGALEGATLAGLQRELTALPTVAARVERSLEFLDAQVAGGLTLPRYRVVTALLPRGRSVRVRFGRTLVVPRAPPATPEATAEWLWRLTRALLEADARPTRWPWQAGVSSFAPPTAFRDVLTARVARAADYRATVRSRLNLSPELWAKRGALTPTDLISPILAGGLVLGLDYGLHHALTNFTAPAWVAVLSFAATYRAGQGDRPTPTRIFGYWLTSNLARAAVLTGIWFGAVSTARVLIHLDEVRRHVDAVYSYSRTIDKDQLQKSFELSLPRAAAALQDALRDDIAELEAEVRAHPNETPLQTELARLRRNLRDAINTYGLHTSRAPLS